jgi:cephalosporin-C deacetylase
MPEITVHACTERSDLGSDIRFTIKGPDGLDTPYRVTRNGFVTAENGVAHLQAGSTEVKISADIPGFYTLSLESESDPATAAVAVGPELIEPSTSRPDDFDDFWRDKIAEMRAVPLEFDTTEVARSDEAVTESVRIGMPGGESIYGWLHRPPGEGPFPVVMRYHGAGVYSLPVENGLEWMPYGAMVLSINSHPIPNDQPGKYYDDLRTGALSSYTLDGRESRETLYFTRMFLRAVRALDFMTQHPLWNRVHLVSEGHSQGGGQAIAAAALHGQVTHLINSCPGNCDHTGPFAERVAGWPKIVDFDGDSREAQIDASRYVDAVNFAPMITVPTLVSVCFLDSACPPSSIYAAMNQVRGPVDFHHEPTTEHIYTESFRDATFAWSKRQGISA